MHLIEQTDLELGAVNRSEDEPISWHKLETVYPGLSTDNCPLRSLKVERGEVKINSAYGEFASNLEIPYIMNPVTGRPVYVGQPFDRGTYHLLTNDAFLDFAEQCFAAAGLDKKLAFTTTLMEGRKVTLCKRIPDADFKDGNGFEVKSFINVFNSFDGSWKLFFNVSETRTVCFNTASANIGTGGAACKHTPDAMEAFIARFPTVFADAMKEHKNSANDYLKMAGIQMGREDAKGFFASLFQKDGKLSTQAVNRITERLLPLFKDGKGCFGVSAADAYNAITEHYTHTFSMAANAPGGTADNIKREAKSLLLKRDLATLIDAGKRIFAESV